MSKPPLPTLLHITILMSAVMPKTFRALAFTEKGRDLTLIHIPWKDPEPGQIVVKVLACGVCHSDQVVREQLMPTGLPRVPGHEIIGDVVAVGLGEKLWKEGDRVGGGWHGGHCGICVPCRQGHFVLCHNEKVNGVFMDGGYAEYVTLNSEAVARIPVEIDPAEAAPLLCAGVTVFNSVRHMNVLAGETVAVQGIGGLGHLAIQFCRTMGYRTVALSSSSAKESLARKLGAQDYIDGSKVSQVEALHKLGGAKLIICTAPSADIVEVLVNGLAHDGVLLLLGLVPELKVPGIPMVQKRLSVRGWPSGTALDSQETVEFAQAMGVRCRVERFPLEKANEAYARMITGKARFRAVIIP